MNVFIVTIGTREIQFLTNELESNGFSVKNNFLVCSNNPEIQFKIQQNQTFPEFVFPLEPLPVGKIIFENYNLFAPIIKLPLITETLKSLKANNCVIDKFIVVYTDQQDIPHDSFFRKKDTITYKDVLLRFISEEFQIQTENENHIGITENITDIDYQYTLFASKCKGLFEQNNLINQIYLLPQGGIDQINHALTLQLIQEFGSKVQIWHQAEDTIPVKLNFADLFIKDLIKHQVFSLIDYIEYKAAVSLINTIKGINKKTIRVFQFADLRKELLFNDAKNIFQKEKSGTHKSGTPEFVINYQNEELFLSSEALSCFGDKSEIKSYLFQSIESLYLAEFYLKNGNYTKFTISLSVFFEKFLATYLSSVTGLDVYKYYDKNGRKIIEYLKICRPDIVSKMIETLNLKKIDKNKDIILSFPTLILLSQFYATENKHSIVKNMVNNFLININSNLNKSKNGIKGFDNLRNDIAHKGKGVSEKELIKSSDASNNSLVWWENKINELMKMFDCHTLPYDEINDYIKDNL